MRTAISRRASTVGVPGWPRMGDGLFFSSLRSARSFVRGYCVPRVVVQRRRKLFQIVHPNTAARRGWKVVG